MTFKKQLAFALTEQFNTTDDAQKAQEEFERVVQHHEVPVDSAQMFETKQTEWNLIDLLVATGSVSSKSDARRLLEQGAIELNQSPINNKQLAIKISNGDILKIGKKKFVKISLT